MAGMSPDEPTTFEEFWPYYVSQHLNPTNRTLHVIGTSLALAHLPAAVVFPPVLASALTCGYGFAWVGHFAFEKNKPASWYSPKFVMWSLMADLRMLRRTFQGTMDDEVRKVRVILAKEAAQADVANATAAASVN